MATGWGGHHQTLATPRRRRKPRRAPASQGHPSQGRPTVGAGTTSKPTTYRSPTPSVPVQHRRRRATGKAVEQGARVGRKVARTGRPVAFKVGRRHMVAAPTAGGGVRVLPSGAFRRLMARTVKMIEANTEWERLHGPSARAGSLDPTGVRPGVGAQLASLGGDRNLAAAAAPGVGRLALVTGRLATAPYFATKETIEHPKEAVNANLQTLRDITLGLPGGLVGAYKDPKGLPGAIVKDYVKFYGPLALEGDTKKFQENVRKQGILRVGLDAPTPTMVLGKTLGVFAKAGTLGAKAERAVSAERPGLRYSFGEQGVKAQAGEADKVFPNLFRGALQTRRDTRRAGKHAGRVREARRYAREGPTRGQRITGREPKMPVLRPHGGAFGGREVIPSRARQMQARSVAKVKGQAIQTIKTLQSVEIRAARKAVGSLSRWERKAWAYAHRGLVTPDSPADAIRQLKQRRKVVEDARGSKRPSLWQKDELKLIDDLVAHADEAFTPKVRAAAEETGRIERRVAADNPALHPVQAEERRYAQQAAHLGVERKKATTGSVEKPLSNAERDERIADLDTAIRGAENNAKQQRETGRFKFGGANEVHMGRLVKELRAERTRLKKGGGEITGTKKIPGETHSEFIARVKAAADKEGLPTPSYMPSQEFFQRKFSEHTVGGAHGAAPGYQRYTGATHGQGLEHLHPEVFFQGLARGIKTKVNWRMVADVVDEHAHLKLRDMKVKDLRKKALRQGLDPAEYAVWIPGRFRKQARDHGGEETADRAGLDTETASGVQEAIDGSTFDLHDPRLDEYGTMKATLVPRAVLEELSSGARQSSLGGRIWKMGQTKFSRIILGGFNLPWVAAGFAANVSVMAMRGATPISLLKGAVWYKGLSKADRKLVDEELGIEAQRLQDFYKPQLGSLGANNRFVSTWRTMRSTPMGQKVRPFERSINAFLTFERKLNSDAFRKALFHVEAKRTAFREIDRKAGLANGLKARTLSLFTAKGPEGMLNQIVKHKAEVERHAELVTEMLGDWQTFTGAERATLGKLFFYPYLRYSLRWAFYTMPVQHPIMTQLLARLGQMNADEVRDVLGGDVLPFQLGKFYFTKDGKKQEINLRNINPAGNAVTELDDTGAVLGLLPPFVQIALSQTLQYDPYYSRKWRVGGKTEFDMPRNPDPWTRMRVGLNDLVSATPIGRELLRQTAKGFQGDDALPFSPRPTVYKSPEKQEQNRKLIASQSRGGILGQLLEHQLPFLPRPTRDIELARERRRRRRKPRGGGGGGVNLGTGGGGGIKLGGGSGGGIKLGK